MRSIIKKKFKITTDSSHKYPVVDNILNREFTVNNQNIVWVSDITYIRTKQGWLYLTTVIDLFDRKVIGWSLSHTMKAKDTSIKAFKMAVINRPINLNQLLIFHSDRGIQYACKEFVLELKKHKSIVKSMSRKGNCWDNAVAESFFKTLKVELVYQNKYQTKQEAELSIFEYIETFYNTNRRHKQLNNLTILEYQNLIYNNLKNGSLGVMKICPLFSRNFQEIVVNKWKILVLLPNRFLKLKIKLNYVTIFTKILQIINYNFIRISIKKV